MQATATIVTQGKIFRAKRRKRAGLAKKCIPMPAFFVFVAIVPLNVPVLFQCYSSAIFSAAALAQGVNAREAKNPPARISKCARSPRPKIAPSTAPTANINTGTYIKKVDTTNSTVTLNAPAIANGTDQTFTVNAIISKYVDGATTTSYRAGVNTPVPIIEFDKKTGDYVTGRDGSHSDSWYAVTDPIPFQYGVSEYDETGVESTMGTLTDSNIGTIGGDKFPIATADVDNPQYINVSGIHHPDSLWFIFTQILSPSNFLHLS